MEKEDGRKVYGVGKENERNAEEKRTGTESTSTTSTTGRGTGGTGGRGTGRTTEAARKEQSAEAVGLSDIKKPKDVPVIVPTMTEEEKKKEQARIKAKKAREKKKKEKALQAESLANTEQLSLVLVTISSVVASRANMAHWQLTEAEAKQIVEPLTKIIQANTKIEDLGKYADHIALIVACITIILPRAVISVQIANHDKKIKKEIIKNGKTGEVKNSSNGTDTKDRTGKSNSLNDSESIRTAIPSLAF